MTSPHMSPMLYQTLGAARRQPDSMLFGGAQSVVTIAVFKSVVKPIVVRFHIKINGVNSLSISLRPNSVFFSRPMSSSLLHRK